MHFDCLIAKRSSDDPTEWERGALHIAEIGVINPHYVLSYDIWQKENGPEQVTRFRMEEEPYRNAAKCHSAKLINLLIIEPDPPGFQVGDGLQIPGQVKRILQPQRVEFVLPRLTHGAVGCPLPGGVAGVADNGVSAICMGNG